MYIYVHTYYIHECKNMDMCISWANVLQNNSNKDFNNKGLVFKSPPNESPY